MTDTCNNGLSCMLAAVWSMTSNRDSVRQAEPHVRGVVSYAVDLVQGAVWGRWRHDLVVRSALGVLGNVAAVFPALLLERRDAGTGCQTPVEVVCEFCRGATGRGELDAEDVGLVVVLLLNCLADDKSASALAESRYTVETVMDARVWEPAMKNQGVAEALGKVLCALGDVTDRSLAMIERELEI